MKVWFVWEIIEVLKIHQKHKRLRGAILELLLPLIWIKVTMYGNVHKVKNVHFQNPTKQCLCIGISSISHKFINIFALVVCFITLIHNCLFRTFDLTVVDKNMVLHSYYMNIATFVVECVIQQITKADYRKNASPLFFIDHCLVD